MLKPLPMSPATSDFIRVCRFAKASLFLPLLVASAHGVVAGSKFTVANAPATAIRYDNPGNNIAYPATGEKVDSIGVHKFWAQMYLGAVGTPVEDLMPVGPVSPIGALLVSRGLFNLGTIDLPSLPGGSEVQIQVRGWEADTGASNGWAFAEFRGMNDLVVFTTRESPPLVVYGVNGLVGFSIVVPEPVGHSLVGLATAGFLFVRRRS